MSATKFSTVLSYRREGGFLDTDESGQARLELPHKKETIPFVFEYAIRGPNEEGMYVYHAAYWPEDSKLVGAIPGLPGELYQDMYMLTLIPRAIPVRSRTVARRIAENLLAQAMPYIMAALKAWDGKHHGVKPTFT